MNSRTRVVVVLTAAALGACRTARRETCFPERGAEVWVESHYPATAPPPDAPAALTSLRLIPTTSEPFSPGGTIAGRQARVSVIGPAGAARRDTLIAGSPNPDGRVGLPLAVRTLRPGVYQVRVRDLGWVDAVRDISFGPGERVALEVQSRYAASCLGELIQTSVVGHNDLLPNAH